MERTFIGEVWFTCWRFLTLGALFCVGIAYISYAYGWHDTPLTRAAPGIAHCVGTIVGGIWTKRLMDQGVIQ